MRSYPLNGKLEVVYPAFGLVALTLGAALTLASAAHNLTSFEFLRFSAFVAICGMSTLGAGFSIEHQATKNLSKGLLLGNISLIELLRSPLKTASLVSAVVILSVRLLASLNESGLYANLYIPIVIFIGITLTFSALRGWAAALRSPVALANSNLVAGISTLVLPLILLKQIDPVSAYLYGYSFTFAGSVCYLTFKLYQYNRRPDFAIEEVVSAVNVDSKLTWAYQGLTVVYLGSTLVLSNVHAVGEEVMAAQAQLYLASAKAVPQILLGMISLALAFMSRINSKGHATQTRSWLSATLGISLVASFATCLVMPKLIYLLTGNKLILNEKFIILIYVSMIFLALSLVFIPQFIYGSNYKFMSIIWWASGAFIAIGFTPFISKRLSDGIVIILISSIITFVLSIVFSSRISKVSEITSNVV